MNVAGMRGMWVLPALSLVVATCTASENHVDAVPDSDAQSVLSSIPVRKEHGSGYSRSLFVHWIDADGDQCNTREEVLIAESADPAQVDPFGCKVVAGRWVSPYDGVVHDDPSDLDIDHLVPLKEAWDSGAWAWPASTRRAFANDLSDPRPLIAVTAAVNRSKGDKDPSNWLPPNAAYLCTYVADWVSVKARWRLSMDQSEFGRIKKVLSQSCAGTRIAPWGTARTPSGGATVTSTTATGSTAVKGSVTGFKPGQFCTPKGASGSYQGLAYVCSTSNAQGVPYKDGRARWRRA